MAYLRLPTQVTDGTIEASHVNDLQKNIDFVGGGIKTISSANYTMLDNDGFGTFVFTTAASDRTFTLGTLSANQNRRVMIIKEDSGAGNVIVDGEGAETINADLLWTIYNQFGFVVLYGSALRWSVLGRDEMVDLEFNTTTGVTITALVGDVNTFLEIPKGAGTHNLSIPPGQWRIEGATTVDLKGTGATTAGTIRIYLSNSTSSISDRDLVSEFTVFDVTRFKSSIYGLEKIITNAATTTWNMLCVFDYVAGTFTDIQTSVGGTFGGSSFIRVTRVA